MKKYFIIIILNLFSKNIFSQNTNFENAYKNLILSIYNDTAYQKTGNLLPNPGELKNNDKKNILFVYPITKLSTINSIGNIEKNTQILLQLDSCIFPSIKKVNSLLFKEQIIDTFYNNSNDYKYNLLGAIILNNIYVRRNYRPDSFNEIFFEVIRIGRESTKSNSIDLIHMIKVNRIWKIKNTYNIEKS